MQRTAGNAAVARLLRAANARRVLARWPPDEQKVQVRAHQIWERKGGGQTSPADAERNYYDAQREIAIEERAYQLSQQPGGGDPVKNWLAAEQEIDSQRANGGVPAAPGPPPLPIAAAPVRQPVAAQPGGLAGALANRGALTNVNAKKTKNFASATEGVEVENPVSYQVVLKMAKSRGVMAWVEDAKGATLAEFTTDMGSNPYTIENRTTPCESANRQGIEDRKRALKMLTEHIRAAGDAPPTGLDSKGPYASDDERKLHTLSSNRGTPVKAADEGGLKLKVLVADHRVIPKSGTARPGVQVTKGVGFSEMLASAPSKAGAFEHAQWMQEYGFYLDHYVKLGNAADTDEAKVFGMLASLLHFYLRRLDWHNRFPKWDPKEGIGGNAVNDADEISLPNMTDPNVKNPWGLLPKTPPAKWLAALDAQARGRVGQALKDVPTIVKGEKQVNATAWREIYKNIVGQGEMIAGHAVPEFTIANEPGFAFEIRTPKLDEQAGYV
jgi:hypothetical protein